jgi:hypothetical protein
MQDLHAILSCLPKEQDTCILVHVPSLICKTQLAMEIPAGHATIELDRLHLRPNTRDLKESASIQKETNLASGEVNPVLGAKINATLILDARLSCLPKVRDTFTQVRAHFLIRTILKLMAIKDGPATTRLREWLLLNMLSTKASARHLKV